MNIRSVTGLVNLDDSISDSTLYALRDLSRAARARFTEAGFPVQTVRVAGQSLNHVAPQRLASWARELEAAFRANGVDYISLGALLADTPNTSLTLASEISNALASTENVFASMQVASRQNGISFTAIKSAAHVVRQLADKTADGFGNLRFTANANCPPLSPFFPVAYHDGGAPAFAIATEAAPLAVDAFSRAQNLDEARENLVEAIEDAGWAIAHIAEKLASEFHFRFAGIDFSLAPYPRESESIGTAIEKLTGTKFGEHGTLFAVGFLTDCLNRANFPRTGFSGVMLPVLEDSTLAKRSAQYSLDSLLLYSTVCGTGLDTIPLAGETSEDQIAAIILDQATLAVKLNKPLTARLMPIPGLRAGDMTKFNFEYFANARVMDASASAIKFFAADQHVNFKTKDG
jgi:uncharacterized protein (UPF0210 family)